jgi:glycosyltransferase involved in cell wall biosynthesis
MHIIILNHYAGSPYRGMEYRPYYLSREWIKSGHTATIVAATQSHIRTHNPDYKEKVTEEYIDGIKYILVKTRRYTGNGIGRILNMLDYIKGVYAMIPRLINENPDVVIASSTYPLDNYPAYKLAKKSNAKYVYEVHDLWPLSPMELGGYSKYHPFILLMQHAENFAYEHVDKVVSILPCTEQYMKKNGLAEGKYIHIPNGIDLEEMANTEFLDEYTKEQIPNNKFIIGYTGTFGLANSLATLLEVAHIVQNINDEIFFILIGKGSEKDKLLQIKEKLQLHNCIILDTVPKRQMQSLITLFSISIIILNNELSLYRFGISPNKMFDYMYAGKPIIQAGKAGNDIVFAAQCGVTVESENPQVIASSILKLYNMSKTDREKLGDNGKQYVLANHTYSILAKRFLEAIC